MQQVPRPLMSLHENSSMQPVPVRPLPVPRSQAQRPIDPTAGSIYITPESLLRVWDRHIPLLASYEDWDEWDSRLHNLLRPYAGVIEILTGQVTEGQPGYDMQIDITLLAIIDRKVDSAMYDSITTLHQRRNRKGSAAYKALKDECIRLKNEHEDECCYDEQY